MVSVGVDATVGRVHAVGIIYPLDGNLRPCVRTPFAAYPTIRSIKPSFVPFDSIAHDDSLHHLPA